MTECYRIIITEEYEAWFSKEPPRSKYQIEARLTKIRLDDYFGNHASVSFYEKGILKNQVWELKFNDGRRIYYAYIQDKNILLLLGGNKNGQDTDIKKSKKHFP